MTQRVQNSETSYLIAQAAARRLGTGAGDPNLMQKIVAAGLTVDDISSELARMRAPVSRDQVVQVFQQILNDQVDHWQAGTRM